MDRWVGKIAVVTGASAGIGLATVKTLVQEGLVVVGLARRKEKMEKEMADVEIPKGKFYAVQCDVSKEEDVKQAFEWIRNNLGTVQILINNAGFGVLGNFADTDLSVGKSVIETNLFGTMNCTKEALAMMQESKLPSHIVNINSIFGHRYYLLGETSFNTYVTSKHAITGFTETLQRELIGQKIRVTSISPGIVLTEIGEAAGITHLMKNIPHIEAQDVADAISYVIGTPHRVQVTELTIRPLGETIL